MACERWEDSLTAVNELTEGDFEDAPILYHIAASANLAMAVRQDLRPTVIINLPPNLKSFPLAVDNESLEYRRQAQRLFEKCAESAAELNCGLASNWLADFALWLALRDPDSKTDAIRRLEESMSESEHVLRRMPFAMEFGLTLDLAAVENEIDRQSALTGGKSSDAAIARLAIAFAKEEPAAIAKYINDHREQLLTFYSDEWISALEIEALAKAGQFEEAEERTANLVDQGFASTTATRLSTIIDEARGTDPTGHWEEHYLETGNLSDLAILISHLEGRQNWPTLVKYGKIYFNETRDLAAHVLCSGIVSHR